MRPRETDGGGESREVRRERARRLEESERVAAGRGSGGEVDEGARESEFQRVTDSARQRLKTAEDASAKQALRDSIEAAFRTAVEERKRRRPAVETTEPRAERRESDEERVTREAKAELGARRLSVEDEERRFSLVKAAFTEAVEEMNRARARECKSRTTDTQVAILPAVREEDAVSKEEEKVEQRKEGAVGVAIPERLTRGQSDAAVGQHARLESSVSEQRYTETVRGSKVENQQAELERRGPKPLLTPELEREETRRVGHERDIPETMLRNHGDPEVVRRALADVRNPARPEAAELVDVVHRLHGANLGPETMPVRYSELYQEGVSLADDRGRAVTQAIRENREVVERGLNERLGLGKGAGSEVRFAVVDGRLYTWTKETSVDQWENAFAAERFYLKDQATKAGLAAELKRHLGLSENAKVGDRQLREFVTQLSRQNMRGPERFVTGCETPSIKGETLHLAGDVAGKTLKDFLPMVDHIGDFYKVTNLKLPEIHEWRMKLMATALSDCSLSKSGHPVLYQKEKERRDIVIRHLQELGDFEVKVTATAKPDNGMRRLRMPRVFGTLMEAWGMPVGDKAIHNEGLAPCIRNETLEVKTRYCTEMVAQDGCFNDNEFNVTRANVLHAGRKAREYEERYGIKSKITQEHIDFIDEHGEPVSANPSMGYKRGERIRMRVSMLYDLTFSEHPAEARMARELQEIVARESNRLLDDEVHHILEPLGIKPAVVDTYLTHYIKSGRVSVERMAKTKNIPDTIRWALLMPPNHPRKMIEVVKFVRDHPLDVEEMKGQIEKDGLHVDPVWEDYGI